MPHAEQIIPSPSSSELSRAHVMLYNLLQQQDTAKKVKHNKEKMESIMNMDWKTSTPST